ncbi:hypothetical protein ABK040_009865 [Willaertia magna]
MNIHQLLGEIENRRKRKPNENNNRKSNNNKKSDKFKIFGNNDIEKLKASTNDMNIASTNYGVQVYDLEGKQSLVDIINKSNIKAKYNTAVKNYFNLIDDLEFPTATSNICLAGDENHLFATGLYPPQIRCFLLDELTMKFKRHVDYEILKLCPLTSDFKKLATLCVDRYVELHAQWGSYYRFRIPKFGRDIAYHDHSAELLMVGSSNEMYRFNLEQGMFRKPTESYTNSEAINTIKINPVHQLFALGCDNGFVECVDPRTKRVAGVLDACSSIGKLLSTSIDNVGSSITAFEFDNDGISFAVGNDRGRVGLFDLRKQGAIFVKDHLSEQRVVKISYHDLTKNIISADNRTIKIWDKSTGNNFTNLEYPTNISDFCVIPQSGMIMVGGERSKVKPYYIPSLGPAPKWCSFVDTMTEELEEFKKNTVYQDFKFLTLEEIKDLGLEDLHGTDLLKPYMHGFFIKMSLYKRALEYADKKDSSIENIENIDKISEERLTEQRIKKLVDFITEEENKNKKPKKQKKTQKIASVDDERFAELLNNPEAKVDEEEKKRKREERKIQRKKAIHGLSQEDNNEDDIGIYGIENSQSLSYGSNSLFASKGKEERTKSFASRLGKKPEKFTEPEQKKRKSNRK